MSVKRTEPTRRLSDQTAGFKYVNAANTDLAKRFKSMAQAKAKAERQAAGSALEVDPRQRPLLLDVPEGQPRVLPLLRKTGGV